jgi:competence protein ComEA
MEDAMVKRCVSALVAVVCLAAPVAAQRAPDAAPAKATKASVGTVNLNTATAADLEALPGIGAKVAARIVEYRTKKGPFKRIEDLMNVQGVGEKSFSKLRPYLVVTDRQESPVRR